MTPTFPITIQYFGRDMQIVPDPMVPFWVRGLRSDLGLLAITDLGLLALAIGWPAASTPPWAQEEQAAVEDLERQLSSLKGELAASAKLGQTDADRAEIRREMAGMTAQLSDARIKLRGAQVADIPADSTARAIAASRVKSALVAAGVPAVVVAGWASTLVAACNQASDAGFAEWSQMEAAGFSTAPAGISSSGASESPAVNAAMPSGGSP